ncbi:flagellar basal body rod protein FlgB [Methylocaldum sp. BRCS4]|nr:flagellar basal body rod protein FlgB [Methylocaldum sp. BRCS4]
MKDKLDFNEVALSLRAYRQELLASNIANADTPNYKAVDFDFKNALDKALAGTQNGTLALNTTSLQHLPGAPDRNPLQTARTQYRFPQQPSLDGNTVESDVEKIQFAENAVHYQFTLQMAFDHYKDIQKLFSELK